MTPSPEKRIHNHPLLRLPAAFTEYYRPLAEVSGAYEALPAEMRRLGQWR